MCSGRDAPWSIRKQRAGNQRMHERASLLIRRLFIVNILWGICKTIRKLVPLQRFLQSLVRSARSQAYYIAINFND